MDFQRQLLTFQENVPYTEDNKSVHSFKLLNLILGLGGYVDSAFKEMIKFKDLTATPRILRLRRHLQNAENATSSGRKIPRRDRLYYADFFPIFEKIYGLSKKEVVYKMLPDRESHKPFQKNASPKIGWWQVYNELKHHVSFNIKQANYKNALDALATAFLLNAIHEPSILRLNEYKQLKWKYNAPLDQQQLEKALKNGQKIWAVLETPLFIYDYEKN